MSENTLKLIADNDVKWADMRFTDTIGKEQHVTIPATDIDAGFFEDGKIITRHLGTEILHGITRAAVLRFALEAQMKVEERSFTIKEAQDADEAFITSASTFVMPVVEIDAAPVGNGTPGPVAARLREIYLEESRNAAV